VPNKHRRSRAPLYKTGSAGELTAPAVLPASPAFSAMNLFRTTIGRKILMAVTGLILIGFVVGHLVGNLQVFSGPNKLNGYAHFLQSLGPLLWTARIGLLVAVGIHIWAATVLTLENHAARPTKYAVKHTIRATLASRTMRWTGYVVLAFILYHLAHFTLGIAQADTFQRNLPKEYVMTSEYHLAGFPVVAAGQSVPDVYSMVVLGFQNVVVSIFYMIAIGLLSVHLLHGADSLFQTLGWRSSRWSGCLRKICVVFALLYFIGNLAIPGAVLMGKLTPLQTPAAVHAAQR
jgi:succinate dehydrogenase / fumarate reductase cytochrome b subunit